MNYVAHFISTIQGVIRCKGAKTGGVSSKGAVRGLLDTFQKKFINDNKVFGLVLGNFDYFLVLFQLQKKGNL